MVVPAVLPTSTTGRRRRHHHKTRSHPLISSSACSWILKLFALMTLLLVAFMTTFSIFSKKQVSGMAPISAGLSRSTSSSSLSSKAQVEN
jgi:hypothetical protein